MFNFGQFIRPAYFHSIAEILYGKNRAWTSALWIKVHNTVFGSESGNLDPYWSFLLHGHIINLEKKKKQKKYPWNFFLKEKIKFSKIMIYKENSKVRRWIFSLILEFFSSYFCLCGSLNTDLIWIQIRIHNTEFCRSEVMRRIRIPLLDGCGTGSEFYLVT